MPILPTYKHWPADLVAKSTPELIRLYERGFQGAFKDPAAEEAAFDSMAYKAFEAVAHEHNMAGDGEGKLSLCFQLVERLNSLEYPAKHSVPVVASVGPRSMPSRPPTPTRSGMGYRTT